MNKQYFKLEESISNPGKYTIGFDLELCPLRTEGSFNVLAARTMGLSYADYLRMCRDCLGAEIQGKNTLYPVAYFKKTQNLVAFVRLLNVRFHIIVWNKEHPHWTEHVDFVKEKQEERKARMEAYKNGAID
jgi:hypothetical protein